MARTPGFDRRINGPVGRIRFKLDGSVRSIDEPVTGAALHRLAGETDGYPVNLKTGGVDVPNDDEPFDLEFDQEFTTT